MEIDEHSTLVDSELIELCRGTDLDAFKEYLTDKSISPAELIATPKNPSTASILHWAVLSSTTDIAQYIDIFY